MHILYNPKEFLTRNFFFDFWHVGRLKKYMAFGITLNKNRKILDKYIYFFALNILTLSGFQDTNI